MKKSTKDALIIGGVSSLLGGSAGILTNPDTRASILNGAKNALKSIKEKTIKSISEQISTETANIIKNTKEEILTNTEEVKQ